VPQLNSGKKHALAKIFIMRGLPGAGKTTWIRENLPGAVICSADNYFLDKDGIYTFDSLLLSEAHESCLKYFAEILTTQEDEAQNESLVVVVDIIACDCVVAGFVETDAFHIVVADIVARYGVVAGMPEVDAAPVVVADIVARYGVVAGSAKKDATNIVVADSIV